MKKIIILLLICTACQTVYIVKNEKEYVKLAELPYSFRERTIISFKTNYKSPWCIYDNQTESFYYQKDYDFTEVLKKAKKQKLEPGLVGDSMERWEKCAHEWWMYLIGIIGAIWLYIQWRKNGNNNEEN